jgi:subtilisin family serine protease
VVDPVMYRAALAECVEDRIQVLNLSVGGYGEPDPQEQLLFQTLEETGCTVVAAMGNDGTARLAYPAAIPGVVAVGATSFDDSRASFGNYGDHIALSAPGVAIWSTVPRYEGRVGNFATFSPAGLPAPGKPIPRETLYASWQGTSMATPHVSGAAALTIAQHGPMSPADVRDRLRRATDPTSGMQGAPFSPEYGTGRLNLQKI